MSSSEKNGNSAILRKTFSSCTFNLPRFSISSSIPFSLAVSITWKQIPPVGDLWEIIIVTARYTAGPWAIPRHTAERCWGFCLATQKLSRSAPFHPSQKCERRRGRTVCSRRPVRAQRGTEPLDTLDECASEGDGIRVPALTCIFSLSSSIPSAFV